ncbi:nitrite transporter [Enterobacter cancerogenus]|uniref:Nitrite transporter n=1 Tax=Enterobacter cancerogenus TaxID=69218 RepID=A0A484Z9L3_9ENTR|nr:nitrite transporter [Enterobacter cancerogenus]
MSQQNEKNNHYLLSNWKPENAQFWENKGKHIARRKFDYLRGLSATRLLRMDVYLAPLR